MVYRIYKFIENDEELAAAHAIRRQVFIEEQGISEEIEMDGHDAEAMHMIVMEGRIPVATARLRFLQDGLAKIERMAVLKEYRSLGIGNEMISFLLDELTQRQVKEAVLHAQYEAVDFYKSCGFTETGEPFMEAGINHIEMRKQI